MKSKRDLSLPINDNLTLTFNNNAAINQTIDPDRSYFNPMLMPNKFAISQNN